MTHREDEPMTISRRRFLKTAAYGAAGVGALGVAGLAIEGSSYALQGIDVSHWQGTINWTSVRQAGKRFAFCKATEGIDFTDPRFATNWPAMKAVGILRGAYHMGRPAVDAVAQADFFYDTVRPSSGDLPLVLDLERTDSLGQPQIRAFTEAFVARITTRMGRTPIIYTGYYFWNDMVNCPTNLGCPLWLAAWNNNPLVPAVWSTYTFWQYSSTGSVSGISGDVDLDAFNGTKSALNNLRLP
jgi:GH25 family lysozyme M1 (1,4-beta-N-acetylmuramidase)